MANLITLLFYGSQDQSIIGPINWIQWCFRPVLELLVLSNKIYILVYPAWILHTNQIKRTGYNTLCPQKYISLMNTIKAIIWLLSYFRLMRNITIKIFLIKVQFNKAWLVPNVRAILIQSWPNIYDIGTLLIQHVNNVAHLPWCTRSIDPVLA